MTSCSSAYTRIADTRPPSWPTSCSSGSDARASTMSWNTPAGSSAVRVRPNMNSSISRSRMRKRARALEDLRQLKPAGVPVTYRAGGSTRDPTRDIVLRIDRALGITGMAHARCAAHTRAALEELVVSRRHGGVENILALGGDPAVH